MTRLLVLSGKAGVGKSTVSSELFHHYLFKEFALATPLKNFCRDVFGFNHDQLYGPSEARNAIDPRYGISPRQALQSLGTEWGRTLVPDLWVRTLLRQVSEGRQTYGSLYDHVVVSDARFLNELVTLRNHDARLVRIKRTVPELAGNHSSETELDTVPDSFFDYVLDNDGPLEELFDRVALMVATLYPKPVGS